MHKCDHKLKDLTLRDSRFSCLFWLTRVFHVLLRILSSSLIRLSLMIPCLILVVFNSLTNSCVLKKDEILLKYSDWNVQCSTWTNCKQQKKGDIFISVGNNSVLCSLLIMPISANSPSQPIYFSLNVFLSIKPEGTFLDELYIAVQYQWFLNRFYGPIKWYFPTTICRSFFGVWWELVLYK